MAKIIKHKTNKMNIFKCFIVFFIVCLALVETPFVEKTSGDIDFDIERILENENENVISFVGYIVILIDFDGITTYFVFEPDNTQYVVTIFFLLCGNIVLLAVLFRNSIRRFIVVLRSFVYTSKTASSPKKKTAQNQEIVSKNNEPKSAQPDSCDRVRIGTKNVDSLQQIVDEVVKGKLKSSSKPTTDAFQILDELNQNKKDSEIFRGNALRDPIITWNHAVYKRYNQQILTLNDLIEKSKLSDDPIVLKAKKVVVQLEFMIGHRLGEVQRDTDNKVFLSKKLTDDEIAQHKFDLDDFIEAQKTWREMYNKGAVPLWSRYMHFLLDSVNECTATLEETAYARSIHCKFVFILDLMGADGCCCSNHIQC